MKAALHSVLREGQEAAYEREHATVWQEQVEITREVGVRDWSIWRSGWHLFHLVEADDFAAAMAALADDPVNERWQRHMATFVDHFEGPSGEEGDGRPLAHVWALA